MRGKESVNRVMTAVIFGGLGVVNDDMMRRIPRFTSIRSLSSSRKQMMNASSALRVGKSYAGSVTCAQNPENFMCKHNTECLPLDVKVDKQEVFSGELLEGN